MSLTGHMMRRRSLLMAQAPDRSNSVSHTALTQAVEPPVVTVAMVEITDGLSVRLADVISRAQAGSSLSVADWNDMSEDERQDRIDVEIDMMRAEAPASGVPVIYDAGNGERNEVVDNIVETAVTKPASPTISADGTDLNTLTKRDLAARAKEKLGIELEGNKPAMIAAYLAAEAAASVDSGEESFQA